MVNYAQVDFALTLVGVAILLYLLFVYVRLYLELRQKFTLGFILFAGILLIHNLLALPRLYFFSFSETRGSRFAGREPVDFLWIRLIPTVLEVAALATLLWLTRE